MRLVKTKDNSYTFFSEKYNECYHSLSGAFDEALKKFVIASELKDGERVLDVCFGLGYNTYIAVQYAKNLQVVALEKHQDALDALQMLEIEGFWFIQELADKGEYKDGCDLKLIMGDATETIDKIPGKFDVIFHDPFSPSKNPELWTEKFFTKLYKLLKRKGRLVTYSCAREVRDNLKKAGFVVEDVDPVGRRGPSTLARKL
jgi:tRNA U34 5-methylaminomethyl-2-thiouridine-forming methyltransferase MnmC